MKWALIIGGLLGAGTLAYFVLRPARAASQLPPSGFYLMRFALRFTQSSTRSRIEATVNRIYDRLEAAGCMRNGATSNGAHDAVIIAEVRGDCVAAVLDAIHAEPAVTVVDHLQCLPGTPECAL